MTMFAGLITFEPKINLDRSEINALQVIMSNVKNALFKVVFLLKHHILQVLVFVFGI